MRSFTAQTRRVNAAQLRCAAPGHILQLPAFVYCCCAVFCIDPRVQVEEVQQLMQQRAGVGLGGGGGQMYLLARF